MSLWAVFVLNLKQIRKEFHTRDRLFAELFIEHFPKMKERLARRDRTGYSRVLQSSASTERR